MGVNNIVTAKSARQTADKPERLLNSILKSIKEGSEFGETRTTFQAMNLSDAAKEYIFKHLEYIGFSVSTKTETYEDESVATEFRITW